MNCSSRSQEALIPSLDEFEPPDVGCYKGRVHGRNRGSSDLESHAIAV